jgi:drug/metabolite transporter (DMT)-like permease
MLLEAFIVILFLINIGKAFIIKLCADHLDHQMMPIVFSCYLIIALLLGLPFFHDLAIEGTKALLAQPIVLFACLFKGVIFWFAIIDGQKLNQQSMSSARYILPPALALSALINSFLGEELNAQQWIAVIGLAVLGVAFFFKGHLQDLGRQAKILFLEIVLVITAMIVIDHYVISHSNWYVLLLYSNLVILLISLFRKSVKNIWRQAFTNRLALCAGLAFTAYELIKFPAMVTLIPVSVAVTVQVTTIPVIMVFTSLIWKERTVKEQLIWGVLSMGFMFVLLL